MTTFKFWKATKPLAQNERESLKKFSERKLKRLKQPGGRKAEP